MYKFKSEVFAGDLTQFPCRWLISKISAHPKIGRRLILMLQLITHLEAWTKFETPA